MKIIDILLNAKKIIDEAYAEQYVFEKTNANSETEFIHRVPSGYNGLVLEAYPLLYM